MQKTVKENTVYNLIRTLSVIVFPLIRYPYLTRVLEPANFGRISFATSILGYVTLFSMFGAEIYSVRELSKEDKTSSKYNNIADQVFTITLLTTAVTQAVLILLLLFAGRMRQDALIIETVCIPVVFSTLGADWVNLSREDLKFISLRTVFFQFVATVLSFVLVRSEKDVLLYAVILGGTTMLTGLSNLIYRQRYGKLRFRIGKETLDHFKGVFYLFVLLFSQTIFLNLDITVIGLFRSNAEVGEYSVACNIYNISSTTISAISIVIIPKISDAIEKREDDKVKGLQKFSLQYILTMGIPVVFGLNLLTDQIIAIVSGDKYLGAVIPVHILSGALLVVMFGGAFLGNIVLLPAKKERVFTFASIIAAVINTVLNIVFIPFFGCVAAAVTTVISEFVILCILFVRGRREIRIKMPFRSLWQSLAASLSFIPVRFLFSRFLPKAIPVIIFEILLDMLIYYCLLRLFRNEFVKEFFSTEKNKV